MLLEVPVEGGTTLLVEVERNDIPGALVLASTDPGEAAARATRTLAESLKQLKPILQTVREQLSEAGPDGVTLEFGIKLGGETGLILAKGTAEVNLKVMMSWTS